MTQMCPYNKGVRLISEQTQFISLIYVLNHTQYMIEHTIMFTSDVIRNVIRAYAANK